MSREEGHRRWVIRRRAEAEQNITNRFWSKVDKGPRESGCWLWLGKPSNEGYGTFLMRGRTLRAHRVAYELVVGPIPKGLQLDHLCRVRICVNPEHLEPVTQRENILRGIGASARNAKKTHCINGHEFTEGNTAYSASGSRVCITCRRETGRRSARKNRPAPKSRVLRTHCSHGHEYTTENTYVTPQGARECRICRRVTDNKRRARERAARRQEAAA